MKSRYILKPAIVAASLLTVACGDFLDTKIDTDLTPEIVDMNRHLLWNFANAMYTPIHNGFYELDGNFFAAASDEAQRTQESGSTYILNDGILNQDNVASVTGIYRQYYEGIRACNFFIDFAERRGDELLRLNRDTISQAVQFEKDKRNLAWYKAEAHIARAFYYSELIKRFGGVPKVEKMMTGDSDPGFAVHESYEDIVEYIVEEIDGYLDDLQRDWLTHPDNVATNAGRFDRKTALAIKSRTLLYAASPLHNPGNLVPKWERAAGAARDVISEMGYTMPRNRDYRSYFVGDGPVRSAESIFLVRLSANNAPETANYPISTPGGRSGVTPTHDLVGSYEFLQGFSDPGYITYANRDPRLAATVVTNGSVWNGREIDQSAGGADDMSKANASKTGYYLKKFLKDNLNLIQGGTEVHVWVVYRYAEILLNYAEAMNKAFGPDAVPAGYPMSARDALMEVRNSASTLLPPVTTTDVTEFDSRVRHERRVELAFEDHRYWDLLRWKEAATVLNRPVTGVTVSKSGMSYSYAAAEVADRVFGERNYFMPFSRTEIVNSQNTMTQNPGYDN